MTTTLTRQQITMIPKIDLHRHLDCSMRWSTMLEIASTLKIDFPQDLQKQKDFFLVTEPMVNLDAVLRKFLTAQKLLFSEEVLERLAFEACEDAFKDGVRIMELRYAPTFIADGHPHLTYEKIHQAFLKGIDKATKDYPIAAGLLCILQRTLPLEKTAYVTDFAIENKKTFLGLDLADSESEGEPEKFAPLFQKAKKQGLHITVHSGETPDARAEKWMTDAIELLGAERIGHGVQSINYPRLQKLLMERNITLEICPYSNYLTQAFASSKAHPLKKLKDLGVPVTINSDDPGIFDSTLTKDYEIAHQELGFTLKDFEDCNQIAYKASFIDDAEKAKVWSHT